MCLPAAQVDRFYDIWRPLLHFANDELKVVPDLSGKSQKDKIDVNLAVKVRNELWKHEAVLDKFLRVRPTPVGYGLVTKKRNQPSGWLRRVR